MNERTHTLSYTIVCSLVHLHAHTHTYLFSHNISCEKKKCVRSMSPSVDWTAPYFFFFFVAHRSLFLQRCDRREVSTKPSYTHWIYWRKRGKKCTKVALYEENFIEREKKKTKTIRNWNYRIKENNSHTSPRNIQIQFIVDVFLCHVCLLKLKKKDWVWFNVKTVDIHTVSVYIKHWAEKSDTEFGIPQRANNK